MNDLEDRLTTHFTQRAQGIQVSQDARAAIEERIQNRRTARSWRLPALVAASVVIIAAAAVAFGVFSPKAVPPAASSQPNEQSIALPAVDASPADVLNAYLAAFRANDCATAAKLTTDRFTHGNGELCGAVTIDSYTNASGPAATGAEVIYAITLQVVTGSKDGTIPSGSVLWFYTLQHESNGSWRLTGGGSGP